MKSKFSQVLRGRYRVSMTTVSKYIQLYLALLNMLKNLIDIKYM